MQRRLLAHVAAAALRALPFSARRAPAAPLGSSSPISTLIAADATSCSGSTTAIDARAEPRVMRRVVDAVGHVSVSRLLRASKTLHRSAGLRTQEIVRCGDSSHTPWGQPFMEMFLVVGYPRRGGW